MAYAARDQCGGQSNGIARCAQISPPAGPPCFADCISSCETMKPPPTEKYTRNPISRLPPSRSFAVLRTSAMRASRDAGSTAFGATHQAKKHSAIGAVTCSRKRERAVQIDSYALHLLELSGAA
jgi:hypothetical protein